MCWVREAAKKVILLMAGPLRPSPPPHPPLAMAIGTKQQIKNKSSKKVNCILS